MKELDEVNKPKLNVCTKRSRFIKEASNVILFISGLSAIGLVILLFSDIPEEAIPYILVSGILSIIILLIAAIFLRAFSSITRASEYYMAKIEEERRIREVDE